MWKTIKIGVSAQLLKLKKRTQIFKVNNWAKLGFFLDPQLGPNIDFNLAQLLTLKMVFFPCFCFFKSAEIPIVIVFFNINQNLPKKWPQKLFTFCKTQAHKKKKTFCCNPPFDQILVFSTCFLKPKTKMLNKNITLNQQIKQREEKGISKRKEDRKSKKRKDWWRKTLYINLSDVVLFMKQKQRRKKRKERDKNKEAKESKNERQEGRKNGEEEEIDRERKIEKGGGQKKLRRNKGRHSKINPKCPFLGWKQGFFAVQSKERKGTKTNQKNKK